MAEDNWGRLSDREKRFRLSEKRQERAEKRLSEPAGSLREAISRVPSQMGRNIADRVSKEFGTLGSATVAAIRTPGARTAAFTREVSRGVRGAIADALGGGQIGRYLADKVRGGIRYDKDPQKNFERLRSGLVAASQDFQQIKGTISVLNKQTRELALVVKQVAEKVNRIEREQSIQQRLIDQLKQAADENKPRVSGLKPSQVKPTSTTGGLGDVALGALASKLLPFLTPLLPLAIATGAGAAAIAYGVKHTKDVAKDALNKVAQAKNEEELRYALTLVRQVTYLIGESSQDAQKFVKDAYDLAEKKAVEFGNKTLAETAKAQKTLQTGTEQEQIDQLIEHWKKNPSDAKTGKLPQHLSKSHPTIRGKAFRQLNESAMTQEGQKVKIEGGHLELKASKQNSIVLDSPNTRTTGNLTIKGDLIIEGEVKVKGQPDWAQKAFNPDDNSPTAPRSIRQRRYTRGRAGAIQAPGVFGKASSVTLAERYARIGTNMEKQQFLAYGQLPRGFENVPGHMGILGSPGAVMARGAMPLGQFGGGGTVGGYGGMPSATGGGGGYIGGSGGYSGGSNQSYPVNSTANVSRALSSTTPSVQLNDQRQVAAPSVQPQPTKQSSDNTLVGDKTNPLAQQRLGRGGAQLSQSEKLHFYALAMAEMGDVNSLTKRGIDPTRAYAALMETAYNRGMTEPSKRGKNIMSSLQKDYYEPLRPWRPGFRNYNNFLNQLKQNPKLFEQLDRAHNMVIGGSNYSNYGTQNASAGVAAEARRTQSVTSTEFGETLSRKDKPEYAQLHGAGTIRETKKWHEQTKTAVQQWQQQQKQPQPLSTGFVGGLSHRKTDESQKTQAERFATSVGGNVKTFAHGDKAEDIVNWAKNNPNSPVVLYSAGAKHLNALLAEGIDPKRITLAEPSNPNAKQMKDFLSKGGKLVYSPGVPGRGYFKGVEELPGAIVNKGSHKQSYTMAGEKILSEAQSAPPAQPTTAAQPSVAATPEPKQPTISMPTGDTRFAFPMPNVPGAIAPSSSAQPSFSSESQNKYGYGFPLSTGTMMLKGHGRTSEFGYGRGRLHAGVDLYAVDPLTRRLLVNKEAPVFAPSDGKITAMNIGRGVGTANRAGNWIEYQDQQGHKFRFLHTEDSPINPATGKPWKVGDSVTKGSVITHVTGSGTDFGRAVARNKGDYAKTVEEFNKRGWGGVNMPHLHLEVRDRSGRLLNPGQVFSEFSGKEKTKLFGNISAYPTQATDESVSTQQLLESYELNKPLPLQNRGIMDIANQIKAGGQPAASPQTVAKPENIAPSINLPNLMPGMAAGQAFTQLPTTEGVPSPAAVSQAAGTQALEDSRKSMFAETPSVAGIPSPANIAQAAGAQALQPELPPMPVMPQGLPSGAEGINAPPSITGLPAEPTGLPMTAGIPGGPVAGETVPGAETAPPVSAQASTAASAGSDGSGGGGGSGGAPGFRNHPESQAASPGSQGLGSFGRCFL